MKILHTVESYLPERHGMSEVVSQISEHLARLGHEVIIATKFDMNRKSDIINGVYIKSFEINGNLVNGIHGDINKYIEYVKNGDFDIITNFAAQQWATDLCLDILPQLNAYKVFVPTGFSGLGNPHFTNYFERMKRWMSFYDMNVFLSNDYRDINFAKKNGIDKITVIPNGASEREFNKLPTFSFRDRLEISQNTKIIIHVGSYTGFKGHDQALDIFLKSKYEKSVIIFFGHNFFEKRSFCFTSKIKPFKLLKNLRIIYPPYLTQILKYAFKLWKTKKLDKVYLLSVSRHDLISAYHEADLLLLPSMIECSPVVLFEAIASKTPFLVTDVGNSSEIVEWTNGGEVLPTNIDSRELSIADIEGSAIKLDELLNSNEKLQSLANSGYDAWKRKFTWEVISNQYLNLYFNKS